MGGICKPEASEAAARGAEASEGSVASGGEVAACTAPRTGPNLWKTTQASSLPAAIMTCSHVCCAGLSLSLCRSQHAHDAILSITLYMTCSHVLCAGLSLPLCMHMMLVLSITWIVTLMSSFSITFACMHLE